MKDRTFKAAEYLQELFKAKAIPEKATRIDMVLAFLEDVDAMAPKTEKPPRPDGSQQQ